VLIHAGAGGVGHVAVQLAKISGADVATTVSSRKKSDFVRSLGADLAINYQQEDFTGRTLEWTNGTGVDIAFDTVGGATFQKTLSAVCYYGDLVTILQPSDEVNWTQARLRNLRISLELMLSPGYFGLKSAQSHQAGILEMCAGLIDNGRLHLHINRTFPLHEVSDAHCLLERGSISGKISLAIA